MTREQTTIGLWTVGLLAAAAVPSPASRVFDGLPWTSVPELVLGIAAIGILGSAAAQERMGRRLSRCPRIVGGSILALPLVVLGLKLAAGSFASPHGFAGCYGSLVPGDPGPACERSFDAPFAAPSVTRYDRDIGFSAGYWRLGFVNSRRFSFYRPGEIHRERLPFRVAWVGEVELADGDRVQARYVGEGAVHLGQTVAALPANYEGRSVTLYPLAGRQRLAVSFRYDDGSRIRALSDARPPLIRLEVIGADGQRRPLTVASEGVGSALIVASLDVAMALSVLILVSGLGWLTQVLLAAAFGAVWLAFVLGMGLPPPWTFLILVAVAIGAVLFPRLRRPGVLLPVAIAVAGTCTRWRLPSLSSLIMRTGGDDWLTYESFARSILETRSLEGGEAVFFYQPFYRYAKYVLRLFLGEADFLTHTAANVGLFGGVLIMTAALAPRLAPRARVLAALAATAMFALFSARWTQDMTLWGLSEPLAWAMFPWAIVLLFAAERLSWHAVGIVLAGLLAITRLNHLPAVLLLIAAYVLYRRPRVSTQAVPLGALLAAVLLLPLAHNVVYGGSFVPTVKSATTEKNLPIRPQHLLDVFSDRGLRADLADRFPQMINVPGGLWKFELRLIGLRISEALWLVAIVVALRRRTWYHAAVALLPVAYLGVHLLYEIHVYYPRHIIAGHLAMAVSACLAALPPALDPSRRA